MDTHPRYTIVGIVMVIIIAALVFWVSWLWRGDSKNRTAFYSIYFSKQSLSGLQIDSVVTMRGIRVGSVKTIAIQPQDIERVRVSIALDYGTPVRTDTRAVITRNLLTGLAGIDLVGSTQAAPELFAVSHGDNLPAIQEGQTGLEQVQQSVPELVGKAGVTLDKLVLLLSEENIQNINKTLQHIEEGSAAFAKIGTVINSADKTFLTLNDVLNESKGKLAPALEDLGETMKGIKSISTSLSIELETLLRSIAVATDKLKEPRSSVLGLASGKLGPGEGKE